MADDLPARLAGLLARHPRHVQTEWEARPASVLVPLYREAEAWNLLYTVRTDSVDVHAVDAAWTLETSSVARSANGTTV